MNWLVEDPWPVLVGAAVCEAVLTVAFYNSRRLLVLALMAVVLALALGGLAVEWLVVTEKEEVQNALYGVADALEENDPEQVLEYIAPDARQVRTAATTILPQFEIIEAKVGGDLKITFNRLVDPPYAQAHFTARIRAKSRNPSQPLPFDNYVRQFTLKLVRQGDRWVLAEYELEGALDTLP